MLKKLRWKFVLINMTIVTAILCAVIASIFFSTRNGLARDSVMLL